MREMKVKAWNKAIKQMQEVTQITFTGDGNIASVTVSTGKILNGYQDENTYFADAEYQDNDLSNIELMWFTGLYDKYGVEIYEGYIVQSPKIKSRMVVKYEEIQASDDMTAPGMGYQFYTYPEDMEAIGTIYENPELLEKKSK